MTTDDIQEIEVSLGIGVPANYREWVASLPPAGQETKSWHWVFNDPAAIIQANKELRENGCQGEDWPHELFCIGEADGNHFFILPQEPDYIYYTNHDDGPYFMANSWRDCTYRSAADFYKDT